MLAQLLVIPGLNFTRATQPENYVERVERAAPNY